jgi:hypothetical protein
MKKAVTGFVEFMRFVLSGCIWISLICFSSVTASGHTSQS